MPENRLSAALPQTDVDAVLNAINTIRQKLPFLLSLTTDERRALPKAGDKSRAFISKALEVATRNPTILPPIFALEEMRKDLELFNALQPILLALAQLQDMVEDTALTANAEAYSYALAVYNYAKASGSEAALAGAVEELGKLFVKKPAARRRPPTGPALRQDGSVVSREGTTLSGEASDHSGKAPDHHHQPPAPQPERNDAFRAGGFSFR